MQVTETLTEGLKREFQVVIPAADIDGKVTGRLNELAPTIRLPGFRPGKVPPKLLKQRYGQAVLGEVLEAAVNESSQATLEERGLRPAMQPRIEITEFDEGKDLAFSLSVELMPELTPIDFSTLTLEKMTAEPGDKELDEAIGRLAENHKSSEPITEDRGAQNGDVVVIDFTGSIDGEAFEGGAAEGHHLELGSNQFLTGFEDQLVGAKAGDDVEVKVTFPEDYGQPNLAGKDAVFETKVTEIREPKPVEIDDDFAKLFGMDDLAALKDVMRGQIEQEFAQASRARLKRTLLDKLEEGEAFEVPQGLADQEYEAICRAVNPQAGHDHAHDHDHDHAHDHDHDHAHDHDHDHDHDHAHAHPSVDESLSDEDKAEYRKIAERRVRLGLMLQEVGRLNNIEVTEDEVRRAMFQEASRYPGQEQQVMQLYQNNPQAMASLRAPLFEDKIVDFVLEMATVTEKTVTPEELMADPEGDEADAGDAEKADESK